MNTLEDNQTYYDLLDLVPDASSQEIRDAYFQAKMAYRKDSVALYSLFSDDETQDFLRKIEEAFQILSHPERRRDYDRRHGFLGTGGIEEITASGLSSRGSSSYATSASTSGYASSTAGSTMKSSPPPSPTQPSSMASIVSIDRVPPMESSSNDSDILVPPSTEIREQFQSQPFSPASSGLHETPRTSHQTQISRPAPTYAPTAAYQNPQLTLQSADAALQRDIEQETEWKGLFLRSVRERRRVAMEELSEYTKISRNYLMAIEEENFSKLPAPVYLRGFLTQIAKYLKLPSDKVAQQYLSRYSQYHQQKQKEGR